MTRWGWSAFGFLFVVVLLVGWQSVRVRTTTATTYIDVFPKNIAQIAKLVRRTQDHLVVVADYCAYGHYSNPAGYAEYKDALKQARAAGHDVRIHIYDEKTADLETSNQFDMEAEKGTQRYRDYFAYREAHGRAMPSKPETADEFAAFMRNEQQQCYNEMRAAGIDVQRDIKNRLPLFMWIRDGEEAVFSVYNLGPSSREVSLLTSDKGLMNLLDDISKR